MFPKGGNPCRSGDGGTVRPSYNDGTTQTIEMPKKEEHVHTFGNWTAFTDSDTPCENRLFFRTCSDCKIIEWKQGSYADHDWDVVTTPPTCQAKGYDTKTCEICGKIEVDNYTNIVDHDWKTEYSCDNSFHWFACENCDNTKDKAEHTPDETGECSVCKELVGDTEGVLYDVSTDGKYVDVIGYEGTATRVKIADTYNGLPVTTIYEKAFYENTTITSVIIPDSVTSIGERAFYYCSSLTSVTIPDSVTSIGDSAFYGCSSLTSVTIGDSVTSIGSSAFSGCSNLTSVSIPDSMTSIGAMVFSDCSSLTSVTIGDSVTSIGDCAFECCNSLKTVYYKGTFIDWVKISIGDNNYNLTSATRYYYSESEPALNDEETAYNGNYWHYVDGKVTVW